MRFKKGDKVWMISTGSAGLMVPTMRGVVRGVNDRHYGSTKMMVEIENGDLVIHDTEDDPSSLVMFRKDCGQ